MARRKPVEPKGEVGRLLHDLLEMRGWNLTKLADKAGEDKQRISDLIKGRYKKGASPIRVKNIYDALEPSPDDDDKKTASLRLGRQEFIQAVIREHYGQWILDELWPTTRVHQHTGWLCDHIRDTVLPPNGLDWATFGQKWNGIWGRIYGAGISLLHAAEIMAAHPDFLKGTWGRPELLVDMENIRATAGIIDWTISTNFSLWALGYCLNNAQSRIALALESGAQEWLTAIKSHNPQTSAEVADHNVLESHLHALVATGRVTGDALDSILWLRDAVTKYRTPVEAVNAINALLDTHEREHHVPHDNVTLQMLEKLFQQLLATKQEQAASAGMVYGRTRAMEHSERGTLRKDFGYALEWLVTLAATVWVGHFCRLALMNLATEQQT